MLAGLRPARILALEAAEVLRAAGGSTGSGVLAVFAETRLLAPLIDVALGGLVAPAALRADLPLVLLLLAGLLAPPLTAAVRATQRDVVLADLLHLSRQGLECRGTPLLKRLRHLELAAGLGREVLSQ